MKAIHVGLLAIAIGCSAAPPPTTPATVPADTTALKQAVKDKVTALGTAVANGDHATVITLTHPKIVELMGGPAKMAANITAGNKEMASKGFSFLSVAAGEPSDPVASGPSLYIVAPFAFARTAPGGKLLQNAFVIGVSGDQGASWVFANGDLDIKTVKSVLPDLPASLKLPTSEKPVLIDD